MLLVRWLWMSCSGLCILWVKQGGISGIWKYLEARERSVPTEGIDFFLLCVSVCQDWLYSEIESISRHILLFFLV